MDDSSNTILNSYKRDQDNNNHNNIIMKVTENNPKASVQCIFLLMRHVCVLE